MIGVCVFVFFPHRSRAHRSVGVWPMRAELRDCCRRLMIHGCSTSSASITWLKLRCRTPDRCSQNHIRNKTHQDMPLEENNPRCRGATRPDVQLSPNVTVS